MRSCRDLARRTVVGWDSEGRRLRGLLLAQQETRGAISEGGFADPPLAREQPGVMKRIGVERAEEEILHRIVAEELVRQPRMERVGVSSEVPVSAYLRFAMLIGPKWKA